MRARESGPFVMQPWITIRGASSTPFVQDASDWPDLGGASECVVWFEFGAVTPPGGLAANSVQIVLETSTSADDRYFQPCIAPISVGIAAPFVQASTTPVVRTSVRCVQTVSPATCMRWRLIPSAAAPWDLCFRVRVMPRHASSFVPTDIAGCSLWLRSDLGIALSGATISTWGDQSGAATRRLLGA